MGFEPATAAGSLGLAVGASVGGRVAFGFLADHYSKRRIMTWALLLYAVGTLFLFEIRSTGALPAFVITFGLALGGTAVLSPLLVGEYFGLLAFAKILALTMIASAMGAAIGPVLTGRIFDVAGSYHWAFTLHIGSFLAAALAIFLLPHPNTPEG